jgi:hypothetical protein
VLGRLVYSLVVKALPSKYEALGSSLAPQKEKAFSGGRKFDVYIIN